ncbi:hypothetical protein [Deinococcus hopiensis]|uniref:Uncharacterized protein n=1 Tax=Deinococcus hopiensis KR-140 TaxID=695939 RepID=A0A1W1VVX0_9DEIO|nr:hypothetical protein [Deinococcus hopiensis]SMB97517.1 hypothetical protein SAMN00790413_06015 [Deinococcus hopiensis KR-140]
MTSRTFDLLFLTSVLTVAYTAGPQPLPSGNGVKVTGNFVVPDGQTPLTNALADIGDSATNVTFQATLPRGTPPDAGLAAT